MYQNNKKISKWIYKGLHDDPLFTISAICPKVIQGQKQVITPNKIHEVNYKEKPTKLK